MILPQLARLFMCQPEGNALRCVFTDNCPSVYRPRGELGHHGTLTSCFTRVSTNFPRIFQVIRAMWTTDPAGSVPLDDLQA